MSLGLVHRKEKQKRRTRRLWSLIKISFFIGTCGGIGYYAHEIGLSVAQEEVLLWKTRYETQLAQNDDLKIELGKDKATLDQLNELLPNEEMKNLIVVATEKTNSGVDITRMSSIIGGISKDAACDAEIESKRFAILTPVSPEQTSTVSYYRGLITVSGTGGSKVNAEGNPEAWFDPAQEVTINFMMPGGERQNIDGTLPLYHSVVTSGSEYRFSVTSGRTGFADASVQKCEL
jgi:hypothetical protein